MTTRLLSQTGPMIKKTHFLHFQYQLMTHLSIDGVQCPGIIAQIDHKYVVVEKDQFAPHIFKGSLCAI